MLEQFFLHSTADRPPLRIGLMLDGYALPRWQAEILDQIERSDFAQLELVIRNDLKPEGPPPARGPLAKTLRLLRNPSTRKLLLYGLYLKFDERVYRPRLAPDPFELIDCTARLGSVATRGVTPLAKGFTHRFEPDDVEAIRSRDLDVVLRWGFNIIRGDILGVAKHGVWSYHHGDNDFYRGGPAGFWEVVEDASVTGVLLQALSDELDGGKVLVKGITATARGVSLATNRLEQFWFGAPFVIQKLYELHQFGPERLERRARPNRFQGRRKIYRRPVNRETALFLARNLTRKVKRRTTLPRRSVQHWRIALRRADSPLDPASPDLSGFRWIEPPRGRFYADPFLLERQGRTWAFFEDYDYASGRGRIACAEVAADGRLGDVEPALEGNRHLSYPCIFEADGEVFMIPETGELQAVELYRAVNFPRGWKLEKILAQGFEALDVTPLRREDGWWFFCAIAGLHGARYRLFAFHADELTGTWRPHPYNPLLEDIRSARPAGHFFRSGDRLLRPAQDSSVRYGWALRFQELLLTPEECEIRPLGGIEPERVPSPRGNLVSIHTYNSAGAFEAIDGATFEDRLRI